MKVEQFRILEALKNEQNALRDRERAAFRLIQFAHSPEWDINDLELYFEGLFDFWKSLGMTPKDRNDSKLFFSRKRLAAICQMITRKFSEGRRFFQYFPKVKMAEGMHPSTPEKIMRGELKTTYGSSLYEFHWEYPIEGIGIKKDEILVIQNDQEKIPMLEWCAQNEITVYCNRCGLDITYEVSKDCPFSNLRYGKRKK